MGKFDDLLSSVGVGEDGTSLAYPETFMDDIRTAYAEDFSIPEAKIQVLETELAAANALIAELKAHNYDLLMQIPSTTIPENDGEDDTDDEGSDDEPDPVEEVFRD